jgi:23S rRNA (uridine2552-2'-O)-methyltransferase
MLNNLGRSLKPIFKIHYKPKNKLNYQLSSIHFENFFSSSICESHKQFNLRKNYESGLVKFTKANFTKRSSNEYMERHKNDIYVKKSKILDYRSRASFKLIEIHQKYKLLRPGQKVLDVGSSPGGWSQIISEYTKSNSKSPNVVAVDILRMEPIEGVHFIQGDMNKGDVMDSIMQKNNYEKFDLILSDICPEFTGQKASDHYNLIRLNEVTTEFAKKVLKRNGNYVMKTFEGTLQRKLQEGIKKYFNRITRFKPSSSRSDSSEIYLVCLGYLENEELKKEADNLQKMKPEEYFENQKTEALKEYRLMKLNELTLLEDLDKFREEIIKKFKIDPEKTKLDPKEEEELTKHIHEENEKMRLELYGRAYKPIKETSISQFVDNYQKEMKEYDEKIKEFLKKDSTSFEEYEEFFNEDVNVKHQEELASNTLKDLDYISQKIMELDNRIQNEEDEDILRGDGKENELLLKYRRWESLLNQVKQEKNKDDDTYNDELNLENHKDSKLKI